MRVKEHKIMETAREGKFGQRDTMEGRGTSILR